MQWIKRNLVLVAGGVVALALLGFAGFYLFAKIQQDRGVTAELEEATQKLETLARRDPYPNPENIAAAKDEAKRVQAFLGEVSKFFQPTPYPQELSPMQFRTYLDNTQAKLLYDAKRAGVEVPTNYWFTFAAQKGAMTFGANTLEPLATQLADVTTICGVLFDAKVNSLLWLKRVPVESKNDTLGSQDYLSAKATTNDLAVTMPYEVAFQGFSSQLAGVLEGMARLPHCFMVTNIVVEPAATATTPDSDQTTTMTGDMMARYGMRPNPMLDRYGMAGRYGMQGRYGAPAAPQPVQPSPQKTTVLEEKPLRFILSLQAVKLKPQSQPQQPQRQVLNAVSN
jgi:hypothetical protein